MRVQCRAGSDPRARYVRALRGLENGDLPASLEDRHSVPAKPSDLAVDCIEFAPGLSVDAVLEGMVDLGDDLASAEPMWDEVAGSFAWTHPTPGSGEMRDVHPYLKQLLGAVREAASLRSIQCLTVFHDHDAVSNEKKRPDFALTRPCDREVGPFANCGYIECKSPDGDLRVAIRQCLNHIGHQHRETGFTTTHGVGVATDGICCIFVRAEFNGPSPKVKCKLSAPVPLFLHSGAAGAGLRGLIRLLCDTDATHFGLPDSPRLPSLVREKYEEGGMLGAGQYGVVYSVTRKGAQDGERLACKIPAPEREEFLGTEERVLKHLGRWAVSHVPRVVEAMSHDGERLLVALVTKPVGVALLDHLSAAHGSPPNRDALINDLNTMFNEVSKALLGAHRAKAYHGDVRASNIIFVPDRGFYLIDWGLAHLKGIIPADYSLPVHKTARGRKKEEQLREKDFRMLALTWLRTAFEPTAASGMVGEGELGAEGREQDSPDPGGSAVTPSQSRDSRVSSSESCSRFSRSPWGEPHHARDREAIFRRRAAWWSSNWEQVQRDAGGLLHLIDLLKAIKEVDEEWLQERLRSESNEAQGSPSAKRPRGNPSA